MDRLHNGHNNTTTKTMEEIAIKTKQKTQQNPKNNILVNATAAMRVSTAFLPETCIGDYSIPTREHEIY
jgi:hypothetical protein